MSKVCFSGGDDFFPGGLLSPNPKETSVLLSLSSRADVYFPLRKRSRISAPLVISGISKQQPSIEVLPDECHFEIFRRLDGQDRSSCACVSKRWLFLLSSIKKDEVFVPKATTQFADTETLKSSEPLKCKENVEAADIDGTKSVDEEFLDTDSHGCLSRCLEGKRATDVRLAAISVGTAARGGLGKLSIRGDSSTRKLTNAGLKAISRGCPDLGALSMWNVQSVGDEGLLDIAGGCPLLTKIDLRQCRAITDKGLIAVAMNCPNLMHVTVESCPGISNESLKSLGSYCHNLKSITLKNCQFIGDQGVASLFSSAGHNITKASLQSLNISDVSLAVIGHYGTALTDLVLGSLHNVGERGFWVMGKSQGLRKLKVLSITSCQGVTDVGLESMAHGFSELKMFTAKNCPLVSDSGVVSLAKAASSLETLKLEECNGITQYGLFGILANCGGKLKVLALMNCLGIRECDCKLPLKACCQSLRALTIHNCPGLGDLALAMLGKMCPNLTHIDLKNLHGVTDAGLLPLVRHTEAGLVNVNLTKCYRLTDAVISEIANLHGETLETLILDGCRYVSDASLMAVAENCSVLCELDVSLSQITDAGISVLSRAKQLNMQILSLAGCCLVSDKSLPSLVLLGRTLVGLNIQNCTGISSSAVSCLLDNLWRCDILS